MKDMINIHPTTCGVCPVRRTISQPLFPFCRQRRRQAVFCRPMSFSHDPPMSTRKPSRLRSKSKRTGERTTPTDRPPLLSDRQPTSSTSSTSTKSQLQVERSIEVVQKLHRLLAHLLYAYTIHSWWLVETGDWRLDWRALLYQCQSLLHKNFLSCVSYPSS